MAPLTTGRCRRRFLSSGWKFLRWEGDQRPRSPGGQVCFGSPWTRRPRRGRRSRALRSAAARGGPCAAPRSPGAEQRAAPLPAAAAGSRAGVGPQRGQRGPCSHRSLLRSSVCARDPPAGAVAAGAARRGASPAPWQSPRPGASRGAASRAPPPTCRQPGAVRGTRSFSPLSVPERSGTGAAAALRAAATGGGRAPNTRQRMPRTAPGPERLSLRRTRGEQPLRVPFPLLRGIGLISFNFLSHTHTPTPAIVLIHLTRYFTRSGEPRTRLRSSPSE